MKKIRKYKNIIERFLSGESGQRFFNFAYSIGAAIVIWGALFKILHLPGGSTLLCIGMGTEVLMFILTAFDRPSRDYRWEDVFPALANKAENAGEAEAADSAGTPSAPGAAGIAGAHTAGATVIIGNLGNASTSTVPDSGAAASPTYRHIPMPQLTGEPTADVAAVTGNYVERMNAIAEQMSRLQESTEALNQASETLLKAYRAITENSDTVGASSSGYVEQMQALNRNIQGLNTIYEIQLKSVSSQLDAIDRVNRGIKDIRDMYERSASQSTRYAEETEKMALHMQQLNHLYERMIQAMTINMYHPAAPAAPTAPAPSATTPTAEQAEARATRQPTTV